MRQVFACLLCALLMASAQAEDTSQASAATAAAAALEVVPQRTGYAFAQPEILLRQRLLPNFFYHIPSVPKPVRLIK